LREIAKHRDEVPKITVFARVAENESGSYRRGTSTSPRAAATFAALASDRLRSPDTNRSNWAGATPAALPSA
jgi:hypothetical protein